VLKVLLNVYKKKQKKHANTFISDVLLNTYSIFRAGKRRKKWKAT